MRCASVVVVGSTVVVGLGFFGFAVDVVVGSGVIELDGVGSAVSTVVRRLVVGVGTSGTVWGATVPGGGGGGGGEVCGGDVGGGSVGGAAVGGTVGGGSVSHGTMSPLPSKQIVWAWALGVSTGAARKSAMAPIITAIARRVATAPEERRRNEIPMPTSMCVR
jgi:hypothetical protein